jgi:hypothetical protein
MKSRLGDNQDRGELYLRIGRLGSGVFTTLLVTSINGDGLIAVAWDLRASEHLPE